MKRYHWAAGGDVNAFFGLMLDNVAVMILLFFTISGAAPTRETKAEAVKFTPDFVLRCMIPGTALGVLIGDLVYVVLAFRLARRTGRSDVTAMPLGLDTPSTFGVAFLVLLPVLGEHYQQTHDHVQAMNFAWHVGLVVLVLVGLFKLVLAPLGNAVRRMVPRAGLLGSLSAIALALIAFLPLLMEGVAAVPLIGMLSLAVILLTLVAHRELPGRFPGALAAVLIGAVLFQVGRWLEGRFGVPLVPPASAEGGWSGGLDFLRPYTNTDLAWWGHVLEAAVARLPVMLPFALATIVGGIDCTESAAAAGDEYDTRVILLTEGAASLAAGLLGGVIQTTPYIGHPAYKKMGGRAAYALATALFIGALGVFGGFHLLFAWLPKAALFPILVFVGLEITAVSFQATPKHHYAALALAILPALAALIMIVLKGIMGTPRMSADSLAALQTLRCLANGFIITSMLWAAALAMMMDGRLVSSALYFAASGVCAFFGIIHSPLADEQIGLPARILAQVQPNFQEAVRYQTPYHWAGAYALMALLLLGLAWMAPKKPAGHAIAS